MNLLGMSETPYNPFSWFYILFHFRRQNAEAVRRKEIFSDIFLLFLRLTKAYFYILKSIIPICIGVTSIFLLNVEISV